MAVIKMSTRQGEKIDFLYSGFMMYKPNRSSACGCGSDDWFYLCTCQDKDYMLIFSDNAEYGTMWECFQLNEEEYEKLKSAEIDLWLETYFKKKDRLRLIGLHLENIDDVRAILPKESRCYKFSDGDYYGK